MIENRKAKLNRNSVGEFTDNIKIYLLIFLYLYWFSFAEEKYLEVEVF